MNSYDVLKRIYKPYKYTIRGKSTIINTSSGDYVIKEKTRNLKELFEYLKTRGFFNIPNVVDDNRKDVIVYEYLSDYPIPNEQKSLDMINLISNLHNKTTFFKEVTLDKYKKIYENIDSNIKYLKNYYDQIYESFFDESYHSPSHYLFLINYSKLNNMLDFCSNELDKWFNIVKNKNTQRVTVVHNNLSLDHYIKNSNECLISWDKYKIDMPVLDLVKFYQNSYLDFNYNKVLDKYDSYYPLQEDEKKLFFILISIPPKIEFDKDTEFQNTKKVREAFDYIFKTDELIRPYYFTNEEKQ